MMTLSNGSRVDAVIFDVGNVLYTWDAYAAVSSRYSRSQWEDFCHGADFAALNQRSDRGEDPAALIRELDQRFPHTPHYSQIFAFYCENFCASLTAPVPGMAELVAELLCAGMPLYALTNFHHGNFERSRHLMPYLEDFRGIVVSGEEGIVKPQPEIFQLICQRYQLEPSRALFIDDTAVNVDAARASGLRAHHFSGVAPLRALLGLPRTA